MKSYCFPFQYVCVECQAQISCLETVATYQMGAHLMIKRDNCNFLNCCFWDVKSYPVWYLNIRNQLKHENFMTCRCVKPCYRWSHWLKLQQQPTHLLSEGFKVIGLFKSKFAILCSNKINTGWRLFCPRCLVQEARCISSWPSLPCIFK